MVMMHHDHKAHQLLPIIVYIASNNRTNKRLVSLLFDAVLTEKQQKRKIPFEIRVVEVYIFLFLLKKSSTR